MPYTITLKSTAGGGGTPLYVLYNGIKYYTAGDTFEVADGTIVYCYAYFGNSGNKIVLNGTDVSAPASGAASYYYTPQANAEINFEYSAGSYGKVLITESSPSTGHTVTLTNSGSSTYGYLVYGGRPYFTQGDSITVTSGTTVGVYANSPVSGGRIVLNGTILAQGSPASCQYSPSANAVVTFSTDGGYQVITIVEGSSPSTRTCSITYKGVERANFEVSSDVIVSYMGRTLATISEGTKTLKFTGDNFLPYNIIVGPKTIQCAGKLINSDITITVTGSTPWEDPVQDGSNLSITQVYNATQDGSNLILE